MKMVMLTYNEAIDTEIMEILESSGGTNYTKLTNVFGKGSSSGTHLGNDVWPGKNSMLFVSCGEKEAKDLMTRVRKLRSTLSKEGVKAFAMTLDDVT